MQSAPDHGQPARDDGDKAVIKCVVWDLDDTLWRGTLLEGDDLVLVPGIREVILELAQEYVDSVERLQAMQEA